jgi:uncharacterized protein (UPF0335 family)
MEDEINVDAVATNLGDNAKKALRNMVARIERVQEDIDEHKGAQKDIYAEAKSMGYDTKALRAVIRRRRMDRQEREEADAILETYETAIDGLDGLV